MAAARTRRGFIRHSALLAALAALGGCGFHPVYGRNPDGSVGPATRELANVTVSVIPGRPGMLLRQALQQHLEGDGSLTGSKYRLGVVFWINGEGIAVQPDDNTTRVRLIAHANWTLQTNTTEPKTLQTGSARNVDAFDILNQQYFAADLENEAVTKRMADAVASQITLQLASWFDEHPEAARAAEQ